MFNLRSSIQCLALALAIFAVFIVFPAQGNAAPLSPAKPSSTLSPEKQVSPTQNPDADRFHPSIAYDPVHSQFLYVWHNKWNTGRDIYAQRVDQFGKKVGSWITVSAGAHDRLQPAVAYNGTSQEFMIVFMNDINGDGLKYDIYGQRVRWDGLLIDSNFQVETANNRSMWSPRIAWNDERNEYMVVWSIHYQDTQLASGIGMKILNTTGGVEYGTVLSGDGMPTNPDVTFDPATNNYLVVWNMVNTSGKNVVIGDLRNSLGNRVRPTIDIFGSTTNDALLPRVAWSVLSFYTVVFEYITSSTDHDIYLALLNSAGDLAYAVPFVSGTTNDSSPVVAGNPNRLEWMIAFQRADVNGAKIMMRPLSNWFPLEDIPIANYVFWDSMDPEIAYGRGAFSIGYTGDSIGDPSVKQHIYTRSFFPITVNLPLILR